MAQQRMMLLPLLSAVLSVMLAAKRPVTDRVRSSHVATSPRKTLTFARGWKTQETRIRIHLLHATSLSLEMHFIYQCQYIGDGVQGHADTLSAVYRLLHDCISHDNEYVHGECPTTSLSCPLAFPLPGGFCSAHGAHLTSPIHLVASASVTTRYRRILMVQRCIPGLW
jgi:hypothetical protein